MAGPIELLYDCERLVRMHYAMIRTSAPRIYEAAFFFSPSTSALLRVYSETLDEFVHVRIGLPEARWGTHVTTIKGHTDTINSVAYSPDGEQIVSASDDGTIRLWNARTGAKSW